MAKTPLPAARGRGALDAFLNLLSLITVAWLAYSIGGVVFQLINKYLGNLEPAFGSVSVNYYALKLSLASLIVVAPVYFAVANILHRKYKLNELDHSSGVYRWLTYLMLLVSALTIIGSLIALISGFLNGNYTANVVLKILTVIVIAGFIFGYYFFDLKRRDYAKAHIVSIVVGSIVGLVIAAIAIAGLMNVPSPETARKQLLDDQKSQALSSMYSYVIDTYRNDGTLDDQLDMSQLEAYSAPGTYTGISYRKIDGQNFELCAEFLAKSETLDRTYYYNPSAPWQNHEAGKACYSFEASKEVSKLYPAASRIEGAVEPIGKEIR